MAQEFKDSNLESVSQYPDRRKSTLGTLGASFLYIQASIGAMLTIVPYACYSQGFITGLLALLIGIIFLLQAGYQYVKLSVSTQAYTLQDLSLSLVGPKLQTVANILQILNQGVLVIAALYVAASSLSGLLSEITGTLHSTWLSSPLCTLYIFLLLAPLFFLHQVNQIKSTGFVQFVSALLLLIFAILYLVSNYSLIRKNHPNNQFHIPMLPHHDFPKSMSAFFLIFLAPNFAQISLPVLKSMGPLTVSKGFRPMILAAIFVAIYFSLLTGISMWLFGDLLLSHDTIFKVFYHNSHSFVASLLQLLGICITVFHTPVLIFTMRESLLLMFSRCCKSTQRIATSTPIPSEDEENQQLIPTQTEFPIMYERIKPAPFYAITCAIFVVLLLITLFLKNLIRFLEVLAIPLIATTAMVLPNALAIHYYGCKAEKSSVVFLVVICIASALQTVLAIIDYK